MSGTWMPVVGSRCVVRDDVDVLQAMGGDPRLAGLHGQLASLEPQADVILSDGRRVKVPIDLLEPPRMIWQAFPESVAATTATTTDDVASYGIPAGVGPIGRRSVMTVGDLSDSLAEDEASCLDDECTLRRDKAPAKRDRRRASG